MSSSSTSSGNLEIDEFQRSTNPLRADRASRRVLLTIPHPIAANHNGGQLQFGPDGLLYISTGDGGARSHAGEPARNLERACSEKSCGSTRSVAPARCPTGSRRTIPFVGKPGLDEIYAYGFRNPWRFSIDNGRIAIGDVGQSRQEEVELPARLPTQAGSISAGRNTRVTWSSTTTRPGPAPPKFPMFVYSHGGGGCAIIGGYVVRTTPTCRSLDGRYLYGDACTGEVRSFIPESQAQKRGRRRADRGRASRA